MAAAVLLLSNRDEIHVPDSDEEIFEFNITLERLVHELVILHELSATDILVAAESIVGIVEGCEHLKELEAALLWRLESADHIRVTGSLESILDFFDFKHTVSIGIELIKSFVDEAFTKRAYLSAKSGQKFVKTDLTIA